MEYKEFAKFYDKFYQKKDYKNEVIFLKNFIQRDDKILDIGAGTGLHASILEQEGYNVDILDESREMLEVAKTRLHGNIYNQNMLDIKIGNAYDIIISMFAVINHLKNIEELKKVLSNFKSLLNKNGKIIIDLHNPQESGTKKDTFENATRIMSWNIDKNAMIETSKITYIVDGLTYEDSHTFKIFTIQDLKICAKKLGLKIAGIYENYNINLIGNPNSKNLQFILEKE